MSAASLKMSLGATHGTSASSNPHSVSGFRHAAKRARSWVSRRSMSVDSTARNRAGFTYAEKSVQAVTVNGRLAGEVQQALGSHPAHNNEPPGAKPGGSVQSGLSG